MMGTPQIKRISLVFLFLSAPIFIISSVSKAVSGQNKQEIFNVEVKDDWLYVNGEKFFVKGVVYEGWRPNQSPDRLDRVDPELVDNDFRLIKGAGFNTIRTGGGLTPEMIALARKHGLMVMHGIWFEKDIDYLEPQQLAEATSMVQENVAWAKSFDNIITYLVMNEPPVTRVKDAGKAGTEAFLKKIAEAVRKIDSHKPVSITNWIPTAFISTTFWDVVCFNAYIYSPSSIAYALGYQRYIEWLKQEKASHKPLIITEAGISVSKTSSEISEAGCYKYGGNTPEEQKEGVIKMYSDAIESGVQGVCIHEWLDTWWRPSNPSAHEDNPEEWYGIIGIDNINSDMKGSPRPAYYALKEYNQALIIEPKRLRYYQKEIPIEIYTTANVTQVQYRLDAKSWVDLTKSGRLWWIGRADVAKETQGKHIFEIRALDKDGNILCSKKTDLWIYPQGKKLSFPKLEIVLDKDEYAIKEKMRITVKVKGGDGKPLPNETVYYSFFQPVNWAEIKNRKVTDKNGEINTQYSTFDPGYVVFSAGIVYGDGEFQKRLGDIKIVLFK